MIKKQRKRDAESMSGAISSFWSQVRFAHRSQVGGRKYQSETYVGDGCFAKSLSSDLSWFKSASGSDGAAY